MMDQASGKFVGLFVGVTSQVPVFDPDEVADVIYMDLRVIAGEMEHDLGRFTQTFVFAYEQFRKFGQRKR